MEQRWQQREVRRQPHGAACTVPPPPPTHTHPPTFVRYTLGCRQVSSPPCARMQASPRVQSPCKHHGRISLWPQRSCHHPPHPTPSTRQLEGSAGLCRIRVTEGVAPPRRLACIRRVRARQFERRAPRALAQLQPQGAWVQERALRPVVGLCSARAALGLEGRHAKVICRPRHAGRRLGSIVSSSPAALPACRCQILSQLGCCRCAGGGLLLCRSGTLAGGFQKLLLLRQARVQSVDGALRLSHTRSAPQWLSHCMWLRPRQRWCRRAGASSQALAAAAAAAGGAAALQATRLGRSTQGKRHRELRATRSHGLLAHRQWSAERAIREQQRLARHERRQLGARSVCHDARCVSGHSLLAACFHVAPPHSDTALFWLPHIHPSRWHVAPAPAPHCTALLKRKLLHTCISAKQWLCWAGDMSRGEAHRGAQAERSDASGEQGGSARSQGGRTG